MENPIKMDDLEVPLFLEIAIYIYIHQTLREGGTPPGFSITFSQQFP